MANLEHLEILKQGVEVWNRWRAQNPEVRPDLSEAKLIKANLRRANLLEAVLIEAKLRGADLGYANLSKADLRKADLRKADLSGAELIDAKLHEAKLRAAYLHGANLNGTHFDNASLRAADLSEANLIKARFRGSDLTRASLVGAHLEGAELTNCRVYGISAWDLKLADTTQRDLIVTPSDLPPVTVDDIEVAQFIYLILYNEKLRKTIDTVTQKGVLLLGRFGGGGIDLLRVIAERLRELGYLPIIFDFERPRDRRYTETIKTLAGLARFVIVDLSGPSVPQELYATVPHYKIPFMPILEKGHQSYSLFVDLLEEQNVLKPVVEFENEGELLAKLQEKVVSPAEAYVTERQKLLAELFGRENGN